VAIPNPVLGGMTTFLFCAVAVSGMAIVNRGVVFNRRNRFILTAGFALGFAITLLPDYFDHVFTYRGGNKALRGFLDAITLIMETGFAVCMLVCMGLNLWLPEEVERSEAEHVAAHKEVDEGSHGEGSSRGVESEEISAAGKSKSEPEDKV
jgi:uric acid-xanthine permease